MAPHDSLQLVNVYGNVTATTRYIPTINKIKTIMGDNFCNDPPDNLCDYASNSSLRVLLQRRQD